MEGVKISISAPTQELVDAVSVAVNQGLEDAGFTNVMGLDQSLDPDTVLQQLQASNPEMFDIPIHLTQGDYPADAVDLVVEEEPALEA